MSKLPDRPGKSPMVERSDENAVLCLCPGCPTYMSSPGPSMAGERIYCSIGPADANLDLLGCLCVSCGVFRGYDLRFGYFCRYAEAGTDGRPVLFGD